MTAPVGLTVSGGADGIVARCDALRDLAGRFGAAGADTVKASAALHSVLVDPMLLASGLLDPTGLATFETILVDALDGPHGLTWIGARCAALDGGVRAAAAAYEASDAAARHLGDELDGAWRLPWAVAAGLTAAAHGSGAGVSAQRALTTDPELADLVVDGSGLPLTVAGVSAVLPDGHGVAVRLGPGDGPVARTPPRSLADVLSDLERRNDDHPHGSIDVRILTMADGTRRVIVDVTGTKSWTPFPTGDVTSLTTNGRALVGDPGAYEQGVMAAMLAAGVRRTDPVLIVGHSEGGMVAVTTARDAVRSGRFDVTHVITAGSPVGRTVGELPSSVQVLALENERDVVPHLDGVANPDRPNVTTVRAALGDGTVSDDHSLQDAYVPMAGAADASDNASITAFRRGVAPYLRAASVRTTRFQVIRRYR